MEEIKNDKTEFEQKIKLIQKKKKRNFIIKLGTIIGIFVLLIVYLLTPLSQVGNYRLSGNLNLSKKDVLKIAHLKSNTSLYSIDEKKCEELLLSHPLIDSCKVKTSVFGGLEIKIEEKTPVLSNDQVYYLNNGELLDNSLLSSPYLGEYLENIISEIPKLVDSSNDSELLNETTISKHGKIYFGVSKDYRLNIEYLKIYQNNMFGYFVKYQEKYYQIVLDFSRDVSSYLDVSYALDKNAFDLYFENIFSNPKVILEEQKFENGQTSFIYYSIKVIIDYEFGSSKAKYSVYKINDESILEGL